MSAKAKTGAKLEASDLCYTVVSKDGKVKRIVKHVSFTLESGGLCALMGPSGGGKSTLLHLLAGRSMVGTWSGTIRVDGQRRSKYFSRDTAYVLQDYILISTLTTEETIRYAARVLLPEGTSALEMQDRVEVVMKMLKLTHVRDRRVGDSMTKGLSGGEAKRLSIAVEILTLPRLILLDEPTSGLDSSIAYEVMSTVREIVNSSVTCLCTIHQPSREIFSFFDQLLLMSAGRLIYFGPAAEAVAYFTQPTLGYSFEGGHRNPAEFVLDVSCGQRLAAGFNMPRQPEDLEVLYKASQYCLTVRPHSVVAEKRAETVQEAWSPHDPDLYVTSSWTQFKMLLERTWVARIRDIPEIRAQLVKSLVTAILMGLVFFKAGDFSTPFYVDGRITSEASSVNSFLFFFTATTMLSNAQTVPYLCKRLPLYRREQAANLYGPAPFWLSAFLTLIPLQLMFHLLICAITYPMVGLSADFGRFMYFVLATYLGSLIVTTAAMALAFGIGMETAALTLFNMFALILTLFAGYLIKCDDIPAYWKWAAEICFVRWIFEAVMVNEWEQYDTDDAGSGTGSGDVLEAYSFDDFGLADVVWISFLFIAGFLVISLYALLPARSRLIKVSDAADVVSVLSSMGSTDSASLSSFGKTGKALTTAVRAQKKRGDLKASLLSGGGTLEETRVEPELALVHKAPLSVDFFRENSKSVDFSGGCRLVFSDLHYTVPQATKTEEKVLLRGITGRAMPGELLALMGASGAGKSTLLDVLAQRKTTGTITGSITYNGRTTLHDSAYMMQDDVHMGMLTVRESIYFAAELRLHQFSKEAKAKRVEQIMDILGLQLVADSTLGTATVRGISGGELRRVSIAVEIVHLPGLMFLDEPTTGLDSSIALEIISAVRNLANQHRTIICTIHQPSEDAFALFDTVLLLAEGRIVYLGPAHAAVDFFVRSPFRFVCNPGVNPAEFIIAVAGSFLQACDGRSVTSGELSAHYLTTDNAVYAALQTPSPSESQASRPGSLTGSEASVTSEKIRNGTMPSSFWYQLTTLLHRRFLALRKDPRAPCAPLIADSIVGFLFGSLFFALDTGADCDSNCYSNRLSLLYYCVLMSVMGRIAVVTGLFHDRLVFYRERASNAYGSLPYCLSVLLPRMLLCLPSVLSFALAMYPMTGLRTEQGRFGMFFLVMLLTHQCSLLMSYMIVAIASSSTVAISYFPAFLVFNMFYAGFVVYIPVMPDWQGSWIPYLSFFRYAFQGLVLNELQHNNNLPEGHDYINQLGFDTISLTGCCGALLLFMPLLFGTFYLAITYVDFEER